MGLAPRRLEPDAFERFPDSGVLGALAGLDLAAGKRPRRIPVSAPADQDAQGGWWRSPRQPRARTSVPSRRQFSAAGRKEWAYRALMSSDLAGEITALATAVLAVFAIVTAVFALLGYRKQSQEVALLLEQNEREAFERRRVQAARVSIGPPPDPDRPVSPYAYNDSDLPIYDVQFWYSYPGRIAGPDNVRSIKPGEAAGVNLRQGNEDALAKAILTFRDAAGVRWMRMPDGVLKEQNNYGTRESLSAELRVPMYHMAGRP
jgi:hypothetical protein